MPARIVLAHDDPEFLERASLALRSEGLEVATFADPMTALDALSGASTIELLVTRVGFPAGKPNGIALARMARRRRPDVQVLFVARPDRHEHIDGLGELLAAPVAMPDLVRVARRLLGEDGEAAPPVVAA